MTRRPMDDAAVDRWLRTNLRDRHQAVIREPLPESLLKLLLDDQAR